MSIARITSHIPDKEQVVDLAVLSVILLFQECNWAEILDN